MPNDTFDRDTLLRMTPAEYLREGYLDAEGKPRHALVGIWATAVCTQLEAAEASPQEVAATFEAFRQALPLHKGEAKSRFHDTRMDAIETVASMYRLTNNEGLLEWFEACEAAIRSDGDIDAFVSHFQAIVRQYAVIVALKKR